MHRAGMGQDNGHKGGRPVNASANAAQVKWNAPDEPGGAGMALTYQLLMWPPPSDCTVRPDAQGYVPVYSGPDRAFKVSKLVPGARYNFFLLVRAAAVVLQLDAPSLRMPPVCCCLCAAV